jgi:hypothetical protein
MYEALVTVNGHIDDHRYLAAVLNKAHVRLSAPSGKGDNVEWQIRMKGSDLQGLIKWGRAVFAISRDALKKRNIRTRVSLEIWDSTGKLIGSEQYPAPTKNPKKGEDSGLWIEGRIALEFAKLVHEAADTLISDNDSLADALAEAEDEIQEQIQKKYGLSDLEALALRSSIGAWYVAPVVIPLKLGKYHIPQTDVEEAAELLKDD